MDINEFVKQQESFLKATDVNESPTKIFVPLEEAQVVHNEKFDTDRLHIHGEMDAQKFIFDSSRTNARTISLELGEDTEKWIGKKIHLETYLTKTSNGKMVEAINVSKIEGGDSIPRILEEGKHY